MNDYKTAYNELLAYTRNTEIAHDLSPWWATTREYVRPEGMDIVLCGMVRAYEEGERSTWKNL